MQTTESISKELWQKSDTLELIKLIQEFRAPNNKDKYNNNELYIEVANKMFESGYSRTYIQCKKKWKELVDSYNVFKKTDASVEPPFYAELDQILSASTGECETTNQCGPPWNQFETNFLIKVMRVGNFIPKLKISDPDTVYEQIAQYMQKVGPISRTKEDVQQRWKNLKQSYIKYIRGDLLHFKYFELMDALLDWEPNSIAFEEDQFKDGHEYGDESYQNLDDFEIRNIPSSKRALNWTHRETESLLDVVQKYNLQEMKRDNIAAVFDEASIQLRMQGFKRSSEQCRIKFKHLKVKYFSVLRKMSAETSDSEQPEKHFYHFNRIKEILENDKTSSEVTTGGADYTTEPEDNENSDLTQDSEHYEIEYLDEHHADVCTATENSANEDVTPVEMYQQQIHENNMLHSTYRSVRKSRMIWSHAETQYLLNLLKVRNVKRYCRRPMFEEIAREMSRAGYNRSAQMCMIKWKNLRNQLYASVRNIGEGNGKEEPCPFYEQICEIVQRNGPSDMVPVEFDESEDGGQYEGDEDDLVSKKRPCPAGEEHNAEESKRFKNCETNTDSNAYVCNYKMDDVEHYCMSLAMTFKRLTPKKQAKLRIEMQKLLYTAEFDPEF